MHVISYTTNICTVKEDKISEKAYHIYLASNTGVLVLLTLMSISHVGKSIGTRKLIYETWLSLLQNSCQKFCWRKIKYHIFIILCKQRIKHVVKHSHLTLKYTKFIFFFLPFFVRCDTFEMWKMTRNQELHCTLITV